MNSPCFTSVVYRIAFLSVLTFAFGGCSKGLTIYQVHGTITLDGQPVKYGELNATPMSNMPNSGRSMVSRIIEGKYDFRPAGFAGGKAQYRISIPDPTQINIKNFDDITPQEDSQILAAKKLMFFVDVEIKKNQVDVSLKSDEGETLVP